MSKTIHIKWFWDEVYENILDKLSDDYDYDAGFDFDEESDWIIENVFFRFYECEQRCSLDEAIKWHLTKIFWWARVSWQDYWYSEYTIEWFSINRFQIWEHNLEKIFKSKKDKYIHILIDKTSKY